MSTTSEEPKSSNNMELLKQEASACGPGCGCHTVGPSSRNRWVVGVIALVAAGVLVARAVVRNNGASADAATAGFAAVTTTAETPPPANEAATAVKEIAALSELNAVAVDTDAVFVFLPGKGDASGKMPVAPIQAATRTIESRARSKVGIFTLKADSPEYAQLAAQVAVPGMLGDGQGTRDERGFGRDHGSETGPGLCGRIERWRRVRRWQRLRTLVGWMRTAQVAIRARHDKRHICVA